MKHEQMIKDVYYMAGLLEGLSCMQGQEMTEAHAYLMAECVSRLELMGAKLIEEDVTGDEGITLHQDGFTLKV